MQGWTNEELQARWRVISSEYAEKAKIIVPLMQKMNNLESELRVIQEEFEKRGIKGDKENG